MTFAAEFINALFGSRILRPEDMTKIVLHSGAMPDLIGNVGSEESGLGYTRGGDAMREDIELFTVYQASNGFYAKLKNGRTVVGVTLSEACTAAQAAAAEDRIESDGKDEEERKSTGWQKVR